MKELDYFKSKKFKEDIEKAIQRETWDKNLPRYYMDDSGNIVEHWKDGTVNVIKENFTEKTKKEE